MVRSIIIAVVLSVPGIASAEYLTGDRSHTQPAPDAEFWEYQNQPMEHDRGFFARGTIAPAWFVSRTRHLGLDGLGPDLRLEGAGVELGIAVGGVVAPNLMLHGTTVVMVSPRTRVVTPDRSTTADGVGLTLIGFGPGLTGYLPANIWGTVSFGGSVALYDFERDGLIAPDPGYGLFFEFAVGKEWWVGNYAGVGIFGRMTTHRVSTDYPEPFGGVTLSTGLTLALN